MTKKRCTVKEQNEQRGGNRGQYDGQNRFFCWLNWSEHWRLPVATVLDATVIAPPVCVHVVWYGVGFHGKAETCPCTGSEVIQHVQGKATINLW